MTRCERCRGLITAAGSSRVTASICPSCRQVMWFRNGIKVDPAEAITKRFGRLSLVARLAGLGTPGAEVLVYQGRGPLPGNTFAEFSSGEWVEAAPDLWLSHDGTRLLLSPTNPVLGANLTRGA